MNLIPGNHPNNFNLKIQYVFYYLSMTMEYILPVRCPAHSPVPAAKSYA